MSVRIIFPDDTTIVGADATDVLRRLGFIQWTPLDVEAMKRALSDRAFAWSGDAVDPLLSDEDFLDALNETGMAAVDHKGRRVPPKPEPPSLGLSRYRDSIASDDD